VEGRHDISVRSIGSRLGEVRFIASGASGEEQIHVLLQGPKDGGVIGQRRLEAVYERDMAQEDVNVKTLALRHAAATSYGVEGSAGIT
jgi:hypothetical protein